MGKHLTVIKPWQHNIILMILAIAINVASRALADAIGCPLIANQITILSSAYFIGPLFSTILAILTGVANALVLSPKYFWLAIPEIAGGIAFGLSAKNNKILDSLYKSLSYVCLLGVLEGIFLAVIEQTALKGHGPIPFSENVIQMTQSYIEAPALPYVFSGIYTMYTDVFFSIAFSWFLHYLNNTLKKKIMRKRYLRRSMPRIMGFLLFLSAAIPACMLFKVKADQNGDSRFIQRIYNSQDGLLGGAANDIVETQDGTLWIATYEGIYRYNGEQFELISDIPDAKSVLSLFVDDDGNMWIGNNGTGLVITTSDRRMLEFDYRDGLPSDSVTGFAKSGSSAYAVGTTAGLAILEYDGNEISLKTTYDDEMYVDSVSSDGNGTIAFTDTTGSAYIVTSDGTIRPIEIENKEYASDVQFDSYGNLYVGCENHIYAYNDLSQDKPGLTLSIGDIHDVNDMYFCDNGYLYIACEDGIGYFDTQSQFSQIYVDNFDSGTGSVLQDYQGNIWFSSTRYGLLKLQRSSFSNVLDLYDIESNVVNASVMIDDYLYVGTDTGLLILDTSQGKSIHNELTEELEGIRIRCVMADSNGSLWISTYGNGAIEITSGKDKYYYTEKDGIPGDKVRFTTSLSDGSVVIATSTGLAIVKDHKITSEYKCGENFVSSYPLTICEVDEGKLFVGTSGDGVCILENGSIKETISRSHGLSSGVILRLVKDERGGGVFVLTGSGLCYMNEFAGVFEFSGFPYSNNLDMYIAKNGEIVVSSTAGVYVTTYDSLMKDSTVSATLLDSSAGLPGSITSNGWNYVSEDGTFYLAGTTGLYSFNVNSYGLSVDSFKPNLSAVKMGRDVIPVTNSDSVTIPKGTEKVAFTIEINNFTSMDPAVRYFLSGVDETKNTVKASQLEDIKYDSIPSGTHEFSIEVLGDDGNVVSKKTVEIVKESEDYESHGFRAYFLASSIAILLTFVLAITNITTDSLSKKQRREYEGRVARLEKEKARALETALHEEEKANKSKSDFLASMSHEIRTPINAILGMDTMILRETQEERIRKYATDVKGAGETLLALINDILDFSKIESGKMELVNGDYDLSSVINDLINMVTPKVEAKNLELNVNVNPEIPALLYGDEVRIKQIILNILNNAVKYTEKGSVSMNIDFENASQNQIALKVSIKDTGIGIKEEDIKKLFSPYERIEEGRNKKIEGTGLGMSITKTLLEMMNSRLIVDSVYGEGSCFSFTIIQVVKNHEVIGNFEERLKTATNKIDDREHFHAPDALILIVDDVEMNLIVAQSLLERTKVRTKTAPSGAKAIEMCKEERFDMILLDSMMPQMSGEETLKHIKAECDVNKKTPVIVLTANAVKGAKEEYMELGFDNYLSKPIDAQKLEAMIQAYLPAELIIPADGEDESTPETEMSAGSSDDADAQLFEKIGRVPGIDLEKGIETAGGKSIYKTVCRNFYDTASGRIELIENYYRESDIKNYTIQVHALKSSARLIGAFDLSEKALEMELAGKADNTELIEAKTDQLISDYRGLLIELSDVYESADDDSGKTLMEEDELKGALSEMKELLEAFDFDTAKELFESLNDYRMPDNFKDASRSIKGKIAEVDTTGIITIINSYLEG